jgi:hypothetical protein
MFSKHYIASLVTTTVLRDVEGCRTNFEDKMEGCGNGHTINKHQITSVNYKESTRRKVIRYELEKLRALKKEREFIGQYELNLIRDCL